MFIKIRAVMAAVAVAVAIASGPGLAQTAFTADERGIPTIAPVIAEIDDAVVNISVVSERPSQTTPLFRDPFFQPFLPPVEEMPRQRQMSAGSGVIVDAAEGYVLTNNHVIENGDEIRVTLRDRRNFRAEVIGTDPATDIALLRIDAGYLVEIEMGDSEALRVGDFVVAIGNPFGLGQTVTSGIVSALGRSGINPQGYEDFIQTDASINPGNSGGALITLDGTLVGINTAIISPGGGNVGVGFAVPVNMARAVMDQLIRYGEVQRGRLGVTIQDLTPDLAEALGVEAQSGAVVTAVEENTAAERAGIQPGDIIVAVAGEAVDGSSDLRQRIGLQRPGDEIEISFFRDGDRETVAVRLGRGDGATGRIGERDLSDTLDGVRLAPLSRNMPGFGLVEGVVVVDVAPQSRAARAGLQAEDVITAVNRRPVRSLQDIDRAIAQGPAAVALSVWRDGRTLFLVLRS